MNASTLSFLALSAALTLLLTGCGGQEEASSTNSKTSANKNSLSVFLELHNQFCEKDFENRDSLVAALKSDSRFRPAPGFMGVYETSVNGISYAVSPEVDGCTTDVMVQHADTGELLFSYEEMNEALANTGYSAIGEQTTRKDMGSDRQEVTIIETTYMSPTGEKTNLDYPSDRPDQYYMTLFAKKFSVPSSPALSLNK